MKHITMTMLIFRVLILALGMLFFEQRRSSSFEDTEERGKKRKKSFTFNAFVETSRLSSGLTALFCHPFGDLDEDPGVADNHDDKRQQEEAGEGEHVVGRFLPVSDEASPSGALSKVRWIGDGHIVENEHLLNLKK